MIGFRGFGRVCSGWLRRHWRRRRSCIGLLLLRWFSGKRKGFWIGRMCFGAYIPLLCLSGLPCSHPIDILDSKHLDNIVRRDPRATETSDNKSSTAYDNQHNSQALEANDIPFPATTRTGTIVGCVGVPRYARMSCRSLLANMCRSLFGGACRCVRCSSKSLGATTQLFASNHRRKLGLRNATIYRIRMT